LSPKEKFYEEKHGMDEVGEKVVAGGRLKWQGYRLSDYHRSSANY
jgi:hypothetical protein